MVEGFPTKDRRLLRSVHSRERGLLAARLVFYPLGQHYMPRPQFTLRALLVAMLVMAAFFAGVRVGAKREQQFLESQRADVKAAEAKVARAARTVQAASKTLSERDRRVTKKQAERARMLNEGQRRLAEKAR